MFAATATATTEPTRLPGSTVILPVRARLVGPTGQPHQDCRVEPADRYPWVTLMIRGYQGGRMVRTFNDRR